jgi:hypothetical protein
MVNPPPRPKITLETLRLFADLERRGDRRSQDYRDEERALMRLLDLVPQWWSGCSVLDKSSGPIHSSPDYAEHGDWHRVRAARNALLPSLAEYDQR